jgi:hypothetical protein
MLFNKAITILAVASSAAAATNEEQRLRGMNTIVNANDGEVNKYVATNPDGILPLNEVSVTLIKSSYLNHDSSLITYPSHRTAMQRSHPS